MAEKETSTFNEDDPKYSPVAPHGELEEAAENVYVVMGSHVIARGLRVGLTMTIIKQEDELTIINAYRFNKDLEDQILKMGKIKHIVRLSSMHGACDQYFIDKYQPTFWDVPSPGDKLPKGDKTLEDGTNFPIDGAKVLMMQDLKMPEAVVWIPHAGGTLLSGDIIQNGRPRPYGSMFGNVFSRGMRFMNGHCGCPPLFRISMDSGKDMYSPNFPRIFELEFENIVSGHGPQQIGGAKEDLHVGLGLIRCYPTWKPDGVTT